MRTVSTTTRAPGSRMLTFPGIRSWAPDEIEGMEESPVSKELRVNARRQ